MGTRDAYHLSATSISISNLVITDHSRRWRIYSLPTASCLPKPLSCKIQSFQSCNSSTWHPDKFSQLHHPLTGLSLTLRLATGEDPPGQTKNRRWLEQCSSLPPPTTIQLAGLSELLPWHKHSLSHPLHTLPKRIH